LLTITAADDNAGVLLYGTDYDFDAGVILFPRQTGG
jgi:hypothetical protein